MPVIRDQYPPVVSEAPTVASIEQWVARLYDLRRDKRGDHERPHKPALLLAILDLVESGEVTSNRVPLSDALIDRFKGYFDIVGRGDDRPTIQNPFFHLCGEGFWDLLPQPGERPLYQRGNVTGAPSVAQLRRRMSHGAFSRDLWERVADAGQRAALRAALITRYFPDQRRQLLDFSHVENHDVLREEPPPPGRDAAFRKVVLAVYDHRCAACGTRVVVQPDLSLVEAAHLVPFAVSHDDRPANGIALCRNHHWAMDRRLIAPCPDPEHRAGVWRVSPRLDDRIEGQQDLLGLDRRTVIAPKAEQFMPTIEALRWREQQLVTAA